MPMIVLLLVRHVSQIPELFDHQFIWKKSSDFLIFLVCLRTGTHQGKLVVDSGQL